MVEICQTFNAMRVTWWDVWHLDKSRAMKPGKEPHAAREPQVAHAWFKRYIFLIFTKPQH